MTEAAGPEVTVDTDSDMSLAAVGLWHKLKAMGPGSDRDESDLLLVQRSPTAWGPYRGVRLEDVEAARSELMANGYVEELDMGGLRLFYERGY